MTGFVRLRCPNPRCQKLIAQRLEGRLWVKCKCGHNIFFQIEDGEPLQALLIDKTTMLV